MIVGTNLFFYIYIYYNIIYIFFHLSIPFNYLFGVRRKQNRYRIGFFFLGFSLPLPLSISRWSGPIRSTTGIIIKIKKEQLKQSTGT